MVKDFLVYRRKNDVRIIYVVKGLKIAIVKCPALKEIKGLEKDLVGVKSELNKIVSGSKTDSKKVKGTGGEDKEKKEKKVKGSILTAKDFNLQEGVKYLNNVLKEFREEEVVEVDEEEEGE